MDNLQGKRVLITAGAAGIGAATVELFREQGAKVHVCDVNEQVLNEFIATHPGVTGSHANVADEDAVDTLFKDVEKNLGGLDFLINCAGISGPNDAVEDMSFADWQSCLDVNLNGAFLCSRRAIPMLKEAKGGGIVNLSSTAGLFGFPRRSPYAAAKWAIIGFTKTLAMELGEFGIQANAICPGSVSGDRMDRVIAGEAETTGTSKEDVERNFVACTSMKTFVSPQDIGNMIVYLCSPIGRTISGQALPVDGHSESIN